ncbi:TPA: hypothetical protein HA273_00855 [Candidatus Bathyarchaeota archaeon]|nr:hypothetical protein [Candidatus Bathyarchaeota archaeon]
MPSPINRRCVYSRFAKTILIVALLISASFFCLHSVTAISEKPSIEWIRLFENLQAASIVTTSDGGFALAGKAWLPEVPSFIKVDQLGNVQWQKSVGNVVSLAQASDNGYVLFCENGDIVRTDLVGRSSSSFSVGLSGVREGILTKDGSYVLVGNSIGADFEPYVWLRKVNAEGTILWDMKFTGGFSVSTVVETDDRGCALAGNWKKDFWLARIDSNGNQQWSQTFAYGDLLDAHFVYGITKTKDGGFMLAGAGDWRSSGGMVPWLVKISSQGHNQWDLPYVQFPNESFSDVVQTSDEGYVVAQAGSATLVRTDPSGSELWSLPLGVAGGWAPNYPSSCLIGANDGGYAIVGATLRDAFLVKISPEPDLVAPSIIVSSPENITYPTSDIALTFSVSEPSSWLGYSIDGQQVIEISRNITLTGLAIGRHNLTVYARDLAGLVGVSKTIEFTITSRFPTELVLISIAIAVVAGASVLLYAKRRSVSEYKNQDLKHFLKRRVSIIGRNRIAWTLLIVGLCFILVFVQVFFPYVYYSSSFKNSTSPFEVGVSYVYEQDYSGQIYSEVSRIKELGFKVIRVNLVCDSTTPSAYLNTLSDVFFNAIRQLDVKVALIINNHDRVEEIDYYIGKWGNDLSYIQILNEPDVASSWDIGAMFTDDEAGSRFDEIYSIVEKHKLSALYYTNFSPAFVVRTNLPVQFSEKLDFVGYDVFMESFLTLSPPMIQLLQKITNKEVVITEFGMSTNDDVVQSDFIIGGLKLFKNMGLRGCWITYWNSVDNRYGIRGRIAEQKIGEWIAANA